MNCNDLIKVIGKTDDSPELSAVLTALGVRAKLRVPKDDVDVRVPAHPLGLCLILEPKAKKSSELLLAAVQFYCAPNHGYSAYAETLPGNVLATDSAAIVRNKLGKPKKIQKDMRIDRWEFDGLMLSVKYSKVDTVDLVSVEVPLDD